MTWTCCQCNFDNQDGLYCGGQLPGGGQIAYPIACGHSRCLMCVERMESSAPLYPQAQYHHGYHQPYPQTEAYQHPFPPLPSHPPNQHFPTPPTDYQWHYLDAVAHERPRNPSSDHHHHHHHHPNPPPQQPQLSTAPQQQDSPLQTYLTSRLTTQSLKPHVITIGDYDKLTSPPSSTTYQPPIDYLTNHAILVPPSPSPQRKEMALREQESSFGFAQRLWKKHCETLYPQKLIKPELDEEEEDYSRLQQISNHHQPQTPHSSSSRKKAKTNKGKDRLRQQQPAEPVMDSPHRMISRKDKKGKEREKGQDYFTRTETEIPVVQGTGQSQATWSFRALDEMDVDGEGHHRPNPTSQRGKHYQATVEDGDEEEEEL
ncbi:hypothetical protein QBC40DRAFT_318011 [Triangularia verruculosa]|uniref:Uncharacterized protein n=1 Tax=Triangularia verruculosa TaxID=2587418 RepID=A0AAN6XRM5_9PEZI|nr:hypothetical protein QBC40DRAFT_318011 [Triangularia verruculosa]